MLRQFTRHRFNLILIAAFALLLTGVRTARAQEAASLAPADADLFIEVSNLKQLRADWEKDPLSDIVKKQMPTNRQPRAWSLIQAMLSMPGPEVVDTFLGSKAALVGVSPDKTDDGKDQPSVLITRVTQADFDIAKTRFELAPDGKAGNFNLFKNADSSINAAYNNDWMILAGKEQAAYFDKVVKQADSKTSLADNPEFKGWVAKLPTDRSALIFARSEKKNETHVMALQRADSGLAIHYAGTPRDFAGKSDEVAADATVDFGPLPQSTVMATSVNMLGEEFAKDTRMLDRLLAPKTFDADVRPHLAAPIVAFHGSAPAEAHDVNPGFNVPAFGVMVKMTDPKVAVDMQRIFDGLMLWANVSTSNWKVSMITTETVNGYRVANVGLPLSERAKQKELKPLRFVYGQIGDWYVLCTSQVFFEQCRAVAAGDAKALSPSIGSSLEGTPVITMKMQPTLLSDELDEVKSYLHANYPHILVDNPAEQDDDDRARIVEYAILVEQVASHYAAMNMQVTRTKNGEARAVIQAIRK